MKKIFYLLAALFLMCSCTGIYEDGKDLARDAKFVVPQITVNDLKVKLESDEAFHLIDVRTVPEYEKGFINDDYEYNMYLKPVILPRGIIEFKIADAEYWEDFYEDVPDKESTDIIIYSKNGDRGLLAARTLLSLGYKNVKNLQGGYDQWLAAVDQHENEEN